MKRYKRKFEESKKFEFYNYEKLQGLSPLWVMSNFFKIEGNLKINVNSMNLNIMGKQSFATIGLERIEQAFIFETNQGVDLVIDLKKEYSRISIRFGKNVNLADLI